MKMGLLLSLCFLFFACSPPLFSGKELPWVAVWDLEPMNTPATHARQLTSFIVSEITHLRKYEVYSQEKHTDPGWMDCPADATGLDGHEVSDGPRVERSCQTHLRKHRPSHRVGATMDGWKQVFRWFEKYLR